MQSSSPKFNQILANKIQSNHIYKIGGVKCGKQNFLNILGMRKIG
jgi:hypothetical protein